MAIKLIANYSKRLGLPGYSSHQFSVSIETEVLNPGDVGNQSERLYQLLQSNVDEQIQSTGFVPPLDYGMDGPNTTTQPPSNGHNGHNGHPGSNGSGPLNGRWKCSDKQKDLILKLVEEHQLDKNGVEALAVERFGKGVRLLNKVEASGLLDELLDTHGSGQRQGNRRNDSAYNGANGRSAA